MSETARIWSTPAGVNLGRLEIVPDGGARNFVLEMKAGRFHGFVVRRGEAVYGYVDRCRRRSTRTSLPVATISHARGTAPSSSREPAPAPPVPAPGERSAPGRWRWSTDVS